VDIRQRGFRTSGPRPSGYLPAVTRIAPNLPIHAAIPELLAALESRTEAVLQAPPGAGKTTIVPLALLDAPWRKDRKILVLEPRRLATKAAARRMASLLGEPLGKTVGYRIRGDTKVGSETRIEVVTEGILTRMLQTDPGLDGVAAVIFDEFHERSLHADLGLALTLDGRAAFRDDLRVLVMSATLDGDRVAELLGGSPIITSEGRSYPVETHYLERPRESRVEDSAAASVRQALNTTEGDILVFLPGAGEIRRTQERLGNLLSDIDVRPLFGALSFKDQDSAIRPSQRGRRKVVLATDIAETSLTIEGVRVVIDAGLSRSPLLDPASGLTRLMTRSASRASADQRRGRAGRLGPGVCFRLWTKLDQAARDDFEVPEIRRTDLTTLALELASWGVRDSGSLKWLDPPEPKALRAATGLLEHLHAVDQAGRITAFGRKMTRFPLHPRLATMLLRAETREDKVAACDLAALIEERDPFRSRTPAPTDVSLRLEALAAQRSGRPPASILGVEVNRESLQRIDAQASELKQRLRVHGRANINAAGRLLALAYPDRIAQHIRDGHFRLRNGRPVAIPKHDPLAQSPFLAVASVGSAREGHRAFLAAPITGREISEVLGGQIQETDVIEWDAESDRVSAVRRTCLGAVVLSEAPLLLPDPTSVTRTLLTEVRRRGIHTLNWDKTTRQLQNRIQFLRARDPEWPDRSDQALLDALPDWLLPYTEGASRLTDLKGLDLSESLLDGVDWKQRQELNRRAPTHLKVPSGSRIGIDYDNPAAPVVAVRLQEVFGLTETPTLDGVPVTMHLLPTDPSR